MTSDLLMVREFLAELEPGERARLIQFFADRLADPGTPEGQRRIEIENSRRPLSSGPGIEPEKYMEATA